MAIFIGSHVAGRMARGNRRGLSMLELALSLPILLFVMALIVNYGTLAAWKVRDLSVARLAVWESRWPRTGSANPAPSYWPKSATIETAGPINVPQLDDARVDLQVARGPLSGATVDSELLDPTRGFREGSATLTRDFALLARLGPYTLEGNNRLLDDKWQYPRTHLNENVQRRVPVLYQLAKAPASLVSAYVQAVTAVAEAPFRDMLRPLDNDDEFLYYASLLGWGGPPNFYPAFQQVCSLDRKRTDDSADQLVDRIHRLPTQMTNAFIFLYQRVIEKDKALLAGQPPPSPGERSQLEERDPAARTEDQAARTVSAEA